jgi:hypothetical protein
MPDMDRQIKDRIEAFIRDISELARQAVESKLAKTTKGKPARGGSAAPAPTRGGKRSKKATSKKATSKKATPRKAPAKRAAKAAAGKRTAKKARGRKSAKAPAKRARKA